MRPVRLTLLLFAILGSGCSLQQATGPDRPGPLIEPPRRYDCPRAAGVIFIDGRLEDPAWQAAPWTAPFVDIQGAGHAPPRFHTRAKMLWDDQYFYIGAQLEEPHVWATLTRRDQIVFHDNDFEVFIDPNGDGREYYEIEINALNTIFDLFLVRTYRDGGPALHGWDLKSLRTAVHVDGTLNNPTDRDRGWSVELALPWQWLREAAGTDCPPEPSDQWRINFSRVQWQHRITDRPNKRIQSIPKDSVYERIPGTPEDNWVWSPQGVIDMHRPETWGYVRFR